MKKNKILITGAAGFIGSNLCDFFLELGNEVIGLDNFSTGFQKNIDHLLNDKNFSFIEGDIRSFDTCLKSTKSIDYVLHQAALGSVPRSIKNPILTNQVNIDGFLNLIEASRLNKIKRFIYAASSSTYGDSEELPKKEDKIGEPLSPYAITKYVNELYAKIYSKTYNIETIGLRYFNVFGPRQTPDGAYAAVIPKFIGLLLKGESPTIYGDGSFSRDFTYIDNVKQMNLIALQTRNKNAINQIYNTAYGERIDLNTMFSIIKQELSNYSPKVSDINAIYMDNRKGDIPHSHANIEKAKRLLNYKPLYSFKKGIESSIKWYIDNQ